MKGLLLPRVSVSHGASLTYPNQFELTTLIFISLWQFAILIFHPNSVATSQIYLIQGVTDKTSQNEASKEKHS